MKITIDFETLKLFSQQRFVYWIFKKIIFFCLLFLIILNLFKFRKANAVFPNSFAFGHSVAETSIFFHEYGYDGICISIGSKTHRNKYLKFLYNPYNLFHFWLPNVTNINIYHAIRKRVHDTVELAFMESGLLSFLTGGKKDLIAREFLLKSAAIKSLVRDYSYTKSDAVKELRELDKAYEIARHGKKLTSLDYLIQQKSPIDYTLPPKIARANNRFLNTANSLSMKIYGVDLKLCTIILRKSQKAWSGRGIYSYVESIDYLKSRNFLINIIGDLDDFYDLRKSQVLKDVFCSSDFNFNSKIFQILSVMNSSFCIGDQSGVQALTHFFNTKRLIINSVPFGQLHYNSVMLPRIWVNEDGVKAPFYEHFNTFLYKIKPTKDKNGKLVSPVYYSSEDILDAVKNFVETNENRDYVTGLDPNKFSSQNPNSMMRFSQNSYFSPIVFNTLTE